MFIGQCYERGFVGFLVVFFSIGAVVFYYNVVSGAYIIFIYAQITKKRVLSKCVGGMNDIVRVCF